MADFWPRSLVRELAERRGIIFLGAGASRTCQAPNGRSIPGWIDMLASFRDKLKPQDQAAFDDKMGRERLLEAAQIVVDGTPPGDFDWHMRELVEIPGLEPSQLHECVNEIDQSVVMTTNYDSLYEKYWNKLAATSASGLDRPFAVTRFFDDDAVNHLRSNRRLIMKLHGTIEKTNQIVLSRSQYFQAKQSFPGFYSVVDALILTRTVLFIGCGFSGDPDIDLTLENAVIAAPSAYPHYALVRRGRHPSEVDSIRKTFNIVLLEYDEHEEVVDRLQELRDLVLAHRGSA
jgi:SIR2-like protein